MKNYGLMAVALVFAIGGGITGLALGLFTKVVTGLDWPAYVVPAVGATILGGLALLIATGNEKAPA